MSSLWAAAMNSNYTFSKSTDDVGDDDDDDMFDQEHHYG